MFIINNSRNHKFSGTVFNDSFQQFLFQNTKVDMAKDTLARAERRAVTNWRRDNLVNKESDTIMRLQDKGLLLWTKTLIALRHSNKKDVVL